MGAAKKVKTTTKVTKLRSLGTANRALIPEAVVTVEPATVPIVQTPTPAAATMAPTTTAPKTPSKVATSTPEGAANLTIEPQSYTPSIVATSTNSQGTSSVKSEVTTKIEPAKVRQLSTAERLALRSNKFKTTVSDKAKLTIRAQKFGIAQSATKTSQPTSTASPESSFCKFVDPEILKKRAERFGSVPKASQLEARKARFASTKS